MKRKEPWSRAEETDQATLVERVLGGDTEAYRPLVARYQGAVFRFASRLLGGSAADAEDVTQETFVRAYQYLASLERPDRFGPWLFRILRSLCRDRLRRLAVERRALRQRWELERMHAVPGAAPVDGELSRLPPEEQDVLRMRYFDGCTYDDIAARLGITFSQVDHLLRKARSRLARRMNLERERERTL